MSSKFNFLKQDLTAMTQDKDFFCFDVETTGLSPSDNRIIQLSMIHGRFEGIKPIEIDRMNFTSIQERDIFHYLTRLWI